MTSNKQMVTKRKNSDDFKTHRISKIVHVDVLFVVCFLASHRVISFGAHKQSRVVEFKRGRCEGHCRHQRSRTVFFCVAMFSEINKAVSSSTKAPLISSKTPETNVHQKHCPPFYRCSRKLSERKRLHTLNPLPTLTPNPIFVNGPSSSPASSHVSDVIQSLFVLSHHQRHRERPGPTPGPIAQTITNPSIASERIDFCTSAISVNIRHHHSTIQSTSPHRPDTQLRETHTKKSGSQA